MCHFIREENRLIMCCTVLAHTQWQVWKYFHYTVRQDIVKMNPNVFFGYESKTKNFRLCFPLKTLK